MTTETTTVAAFIQAHGLTMTAAPAASNPNASGEWGKGASHWLCTITSDGRTLDVPFSQGAAHRRWIEPRDTTGRLGALHRAAPADIRKNHAPIRAYYEKESVDLHNYRATCTEPTPPTLESVLDCLASDAASYDNARDFEDWAAEFGMDTDSRKAEQSYRVTGEQSKRLRHLLGDEAYQALLFNTDRL